MPPLPPLPRSPRQPPKSPPPSVPLMKLQSLGLELGSSGSASSLQLPHSNSSRATTPSDLDKPLPLEPRELRKRTSSIYSIETTITNIIDLYNGPREEDHPPMPGIYQASSYRDTLATLMNRRMSLEEAHHPMPALPKIPLHLETSVAGTLSVAGGQEIVPAISATDSKAAPSFVEFSRNLQQKRDEMVSPFSTVSLEQHRRAALDALAPSSPGAASSADMSPCDGTDFQHSYAFLPGPISATVTDIVTTDLVPAPLDLNRTSGILESQQAAREARAEHLGFDDDDEELDLSTPYPEYEDDCWSSDSATYKSIGEVSQHKVKETMQEPFLDKEDQRIMSYAAEKYPAMQGSSSYINSLRSSRSSFTQKASEIMTRMSLTSRKNSDKSRYSPVEVQPRERQRAIQPTPYQLYGPSIWNSDRKKKNPKDRKAQLSLQHQNSSTFNGQDYPRAVQRAKTMPGPGDLEDVSHGQSQISSAFQKLTKRSSQRRREKLKNSIILVGPAHLTKEGNAASTPKRWL